MIRSWVLSIAGIRALTGAAIAKMTKALTHHETTNMGLTPQAASEIALARTGAVQTVVLEQRNGPIYIIIVEHETGAREAVRIDGASTRATEHDDISGHEMVEIDIYDHSDDS